MTCEELYVRNIENGIRAIRMGNKSPKDVNVGLHLNKLKLVNLGLHEDLLRKYSNVVKDYKNRC
jgi:hypothetical protein